MDKVWCKQREKNSKLDHSDKVGANHGEHPRMKGSLKTVQSFLQEQDALPEYELEKNYPKDGGGVRV
jgi:hypothetical protein